MRHFKLIFLIFQASLLIEDQHAMSQSMVTRQKIEQLENTYRESYGTERIALLNQLTAYYMGTDLKKAVKYGKLAVSLSENIFNEGEGTTKEDPLHLEYKSYHLLGEAYYHSGKYYNAQQNLQKALTAANRSNYIEGMDRTSPYLSKLDSISEQQGGIKSNIISRSIQSLDLGDKIYDASLDINISNHLKTADILQKKGDFDAAILELNQAINLLRNKGDQEKIGQVSAKIEEIQNLQAQEKRTIEFYEQAIKEQERLADSLSLNLEKQRGAVWGLSDSEGAKEKPVVNSVPEIRNLQDAVEILEEKKDDYENLANEFQEKKDYERANQYRTLAREYENEIQKRELVEAELTMLRQQKRITELDLLTKESELDRQSRTRKNLYIGSGLLIALAVALSMLYLTKKRDHRRLSLAYNILDQTKAQLEVAERHIKKLLGQQLSTDIAMELIAEPSESSVRRKFACIMFLDIRGFTEFAEKREPEEIVKYQNEIFSIMIRVIHGFNGIIHQFLGDGFMATFGIPLSKGNDCQNAFDAALAILDKIKAAEKEGTIPATRVGIGLHAGSVVSGNVGTEMRKQYSITGNAVIIAARIEQLNKKFNTQFLISEDVYVKLDTYTGPEAFEEVAIKGRKRPIRILKVV